MTVEIEAASLFAVSEYRQVNIGTAFVISDSLARLTWEPHMRLAAVNRGLRHLLKTSVDVLLEIDP